MDLDGLHGISQPPQRFAESLNAEWDDIRLGRVPKPNGIIYAAGYGPYVKIGWTGDDLRNRISGIQVGTPELLTVYGTIPGTFRMERRLHVRFAQYRLRGEWFRNEGDVRAYGAKKMVQRWGMDTLWSSSIGTTTRLSVALIQSSHGQASLPCWHASQATVRTVIVETAQRFARDLMVQEVGFSMLRDMGITLIAADSPMSFLDDGPTSTLIRQILGAVAQFDKAMTVAKLKGARERVRRLKGKCEGRKSYAERDGGDALVALARELRVNPKGRPHSLRTVAAGLAERGYVTPNGLPYPAAPGCCCTAADGRR
jgi:hypothetical protein